MKHILDEAFWQFVSENAHKSPDALRLKYHKTSGSDALDYSLAIIQIECRQRFGNKLAETLKRYPHFLFPGKLAGEQSTSDLLASWHVSLVGEVDTLVDMTAGLGIDVFHCASKVRRITAIEMQETLTEALEYNAKGLGISNITVLCGDCTTMLNENTIPHSEVAFIDPARRAADGSRIFAVSDCNPDVVAMLPKLRTCFNRILVKLSPMLDVSATEKELGHNVSAIYVAGTRTECKEVVVELDFTRQSAKALRHAVTILPDGSTFTLSEENDAEPNILTGTPGKGNYIYEPYPSLMKAGLWNELCLKFPDIRKVSDNTHIFFTRNQLTDFPGNGYVLEEVIPWMSKHLKRLNNKYPRAEVAVRNFGMTAQALQKKLQVTDGPDVRILGITDSRGVKMLLILKEL